MTWTCLNLDDDLHPKQWKKLITKAEKILPLTFLGPVAASFQLLDVKIGAIPELPEWKTELSLQC